MGGEIAANVLLRKRSQINSGKIWSEVKKMVWIYYKKFEEEGSPYYAT